MDRSSRLAQLLTTQPNFPLAVILGQEGLPDIGVLALPDPGTQFSDARIQVSENRRQEILSW